MIEKLPFLFWPREPNLTTLIFHRVLSKPDRLRPGDPDLGRFDHVMRFVAKNFSTLPLIEAVGRLQNGTLPHRTCCITFDDGYADNLTNALPILEKYGFPATVFVATGYLDGGRMFNDAVIDAIAHTDKEKLDLSEIGLGVYALTSDEERRSAISAILDQIKFKPPEERDQQVARILEISECGPLPPDIMLSSQQVRELADRGVEIGGHTMAHTILTTLADEQAQDEILKGKLQLEALIDRPVTSFAYPNGKPGRDYQERHIPLVKKAGFERAVTTAYGIGMRDSDIYQLPRFTPWARNASKMAAQLLLNTRHSS